MATVVGQASAAATSVAIPAHQVGDMILVFARGTTASPTKPAASGTVPAWDTLQSAVANSVALHSAAFRATATTTTTGTWTGATHICVLVLRPGAGNKLQTAAARSSVGNGNNTQTIIYPALTLNNGGGAGTSYGVRCGTRGVADSEIGTNIPSGWSNQSIQPAGASALMAVHVRATLPGNPTADSIATAGSNAAYRAHTIEVEEVSTIVTFAATITRAAAVAVTQVDNQPSLAASVVGVSALVAETEVESGLVLVEFAAAITTNQPYAGVYDCGEFTCGVGSPVAVDLQTISIEVLDGLVAGQAQVAASLVVTRSLAVGVAGVGAVTAQQAQTRGVAASVAGAGAVTTQQGVTRSVAAPVTGASAVAADTFVGHTISFGCTVAGQSAVAPALGRVFALASTVVGAGALSAQTVEERTLEVGVTGTGVVAPSLTVTNASFVSLDASISGQGSLSVQLASQRSLAAAISGVGSLATQQAPLRGFAATITRQGAVTAQLTPSTPLAASIARAAAVSADLTVTAPVGGIVDFGCTVARAAAVTVQSSKTTGMAVEISRAAAVSPTLSTVNVISFACSIKQVLAGEKNAGTFLVGSGPGATVEAQMGPAITYFTATIARAATVTVPAEWERTLAPSLITGQSAVSAQVLIFRGLEASIARTATVSIDGRVIRLVQFECEIKVIPHIVGTYLAGQQVVGGTGPRANVTVNVSGLRTTFDAAISGKTNISSLLLPSTSFASAITGQAFISTEVKPSTAFNAVVGGKANVAPYFILDKLILGNAVTGKAAIKAKIGLGWLVPTEPAGIILTPTDEESLILVPTTNGSVTLAPTTPGSVTLVPTDEEDLLLVPTTERTM